MSHFSESYASARTKFLATAAQVNASVQSYYLDDAKELAVDVATVGQADSACLVLSSGLHGVEGFFGSAVQLSLLENIQRNGLDGVRYVFIHALNPYGFKNLRRFNENNIDLNRNFLRPDESYTGAPAGYDLLNSFLNPESMRGMYEPYRLKALGYILRYGMSSLKASVASGQFDYPKGVFFGGNNVSATFQLVERYYSSWLGQSENVLHLDLHSGLGKYGAYKLLLNEDINTRNYQWYAKTFDEQNVEPLPGADGTAYPVKGSLGGWLQNRFDSRTFRFVGAEFGTFSPVRVLGAIRAENRGYHYGYRSASQKDQVRKELVECFCPVDQQWRAQVLQASMTICDRSVNGLKAMGD